MIAIVLVDVVRWLVVGALAYAAVVAATHWAVRSHKLTPFGAWPRTVRRLSDPVLQPIERRLVRAGGMPQSAAYWLLALVVIGGLLLVSLVKWAIGFVYSLGALAGAGPEVWLVTLLSWTFTILRFALLIRVIASWFGISLYSRWMRPVVALTEWILEPLRRVLPPFGPLDLSPLVAYFILWLAERVIIGAFI
ncbi:MAG TPA: YggT family protein [Gemmatimonadales bacterium]|nr:YggT family protein [Gemmatimonadales bacterium]